MKRETVVTSLCQLTSDWLSQILRDNGAITHRSVAAIDVDVRSWELSTVVKIKTSYTRGSQGYLPDRLFLGAAI